MAAESTPRDLAPEPLRLGRDVFQSLIEPRLSQTRRVTWQERLFGNRGNRPPAVIWDSRELDVDVCLLFVLGGARFDPRPHLSAWLEAGHLLVVDHALAGGIPADRHEQVLAVPSPHDLLATLAHACLDLRVFQLRSFAITGTNGKTSCASLLAGLLSGCHGKAVAQLGTLGFFDGHRRLENSFPTTPDFPSFCRFLNHLVQVGTDTLVMEASSHALVTGRLGPWLFDGAILTNLTPDHLDFHGTMDDYWAAKRRLFTEHLKAKAPVAIHCARSPWEALATELLAAGHPVGLVDPPAAKEWGKLPAGTRLELAFTSKSSSLTPAAGRTAGGLSFSLERHTLQGESEGPTGAGKPREILKVAAPSLAGQFQAENLSVCLLLAELLGEASGTLAQNARTLAPIRGRMERVDTPAHGPFSPRVFVDYAHTPDALESALRSLLAEKEPLGSLIFTVFGCGGNRDKTKRPEMGRIASMMSDYVIVTSDNPRDEDPGAIVLDVTAGCSPESKWEAILDREEAIKRALELAGPEDIVLIAGKGHEDYQIVAGRKSPFSDAKIARKVLDETFLPQSLSRSDA